MKGKLTSLERAANTQDGNPVWVMCFDDQTPIRTKRDAQVAYDVGWDSLGKTFEVTIEKERVTKMVEVPA